MKDQTPQSWRKRIQSFLAESGVLRPVTDAAAECETSIQVDGVSGSLDAFLLARLFRKNTGVTLCIVDSEETGAYLLSDLEQILSGTDDLLLFPASNRRVYDPGHVDDSSRLVQRLDVMRALIAGFSGIIITPVTALQEFLQSPDSLSDAVRRIRVGDVVPFESFVQDLAHAGFRDVDFVEEPGEFAVRGGIVDIFPFAGEYPIRLEFFGDEVLSIREFDPRSQRSLSTRAEVLIVPDVVLDPEKRQSTLLNFLPERSLLVVPHLAAVQDAAVRFFETIEHAYARLDPPAAADAPPPERQYLAPTRFLDHITERPVAFLGDAPPGRVSINVGSGPQPPVNGQLPVLRDHIRSNTDRGWATVILCDSRGQLARLEELLGDVSEGFNYELHLASLHEGFVVPAARLAVYTDHQIFNRFHRPTVRARRKHLGGLTLKELKSLKPGDFVVHVDHGIGRFGGLERIEVRGKASESVRLLYEDQDRLYVSVNALHKIHKYSGSEGHRPRVTRLGSGQWERAKGKAKKRVKELARDLIALYAKRKSVPGLAFSPDSVWQREMEASFQYEDTPDQEQSAREVKADMEQATPMDRLVCGDVGFGKTEIAVRAAFKAVQDGKQVAVLVPTTVLAAQHENTFAQRLKQYPVRVAVLSRFRTKAEQNKTIEELESGAIDVVIGTQRLVSKDVVFKDLGLLIVDEEQRFGVAVKERLRKLRAAVDTLTLTATPIPRTLQFSLLGARDLSIMSTAPPNRQPIATEIHSADRDLIRDAILYEVHRGGQVFFIHNRVKTIVETAEMLRALVPDVRFSVAHGQMKPRELEQVMMQFMTHKFDVLVCTNIVESGLDVTSANTIIIDRADRFGLADLHQLRGRVGRSDQKAFCFLLTPPLESLTREARQRLQSIEEFSDLGSGFNIAMRDLDIRGAGNLLGSQQSGFINEVGYETYHRILDEAVRELRTEEFSAVLGDEEQPPPVECTVDVEVDALIGSGYVREPNERLDLYRKLSESASIQDIEDVRAELVDRFGPLPDQTRNLLAASQLRVWGSELRLSRVAFKNQRLFLSFPTEDQDPVFFDLVFQPLLAKLEQVGRRVVLKQGSKRVRAITQDVPDLRTALELIMRLTSGLDLNIPG